MALQPDKVYGPDDFYSVTVSDGDHSIELGVAKAVALEPDMYWHQVMTAAIRSIKETKRDSQR